MPAVCYVPLLCAGHPSQHVAAFVGSSLWSTITPGQATKASVRGPVPWDWTAIGTVALAILTLTTLVWAIYVTISDRRRADKERSEADKRLQEERAASEQRLLDDRKHADEVRRREHQVANAVDLIGRIAELQHFMGVLPAATFGRMRTDRPKDHLQELGEQELHIAIRSLRRGAWAEAMMLGTAEAAKEASDRYCHLVRLVYEATGTPFMPERDIETLLNYARWVRISLRMLADDESVPAIHGASPEYPVLGSAEDVPVWLPRPLPAGWDDGADIDAPVRRSGRRT